MKLTNPTPAQGDAIAATDPKLMAVAGPGSGKTATLVSRVTALIEAGTPPEQIVLLTFTNAAAHEMAERLAACIGDRTEAMFVGTLHAFALHNLKRFADRLGYTNGIALIDPDAADDLLAETARQMGCRDPLSHLKALRGDGVPSLKDYEFDSARITVRAFYDHMRTAGVVDYDALLSEFERLLKNPPPELADAFCHLFVDEVQDSSPTDWRIYRAMPVPNKFFVGDPDQAIYGFRGGDVTEMLMEAIRPDVRMIKLEENFRSSRDICAAAQGLIERNTRRMPKVTYAFSDDRGTVELLTMAETAEQEVATVSGRVKDLLAAGVGSVGIVARANAIADEFRKGLQAFGIELVQRKLVQLPRDWKFARNLVEFVADPENDTVAFFFLQALLVVNGATPKAAKQQARDARIAAQAAGLSLNAASPLLRHARVIEATTVMRTALIGRASREARSIVVDKARELPRDASASDLALALADVRPYEQEEPGGNVRVMTVHGSKGREFDAVFMVGMEEEVFPGRRNSSEKLNLEEERRIAYVGATRARRSLFLSCARKRRTPWGDVQDHRPSRFVEELLAGVGR